MSYLLDKAMVPPRQTDFLLDAQPPELQDAFQFLPATDMHEAGKFGPRNTRKATKGAKCFRGLRFLHTLHDHSPDGKKLA